MLVHIPLQIAGIILDSCARGRHKHVWFSVSHDLKMDAERCVGVEWREAR